METWKPVSGYPALDGFAEVSSLGGVRTLDSARPSKRALQPVQNRSGVTLSPWIGRNGYANVAMKIGEQRTKYLVHRLVAFAFVDGHFDGATVDHINGNKIDNRADNLRWVTRARNTALQWQTGLVNLRGERHPSAKLTNAEAREIAELSANGAKAIALAERFGISTALVYKIRRGQKPLRG